MKKLLFLILLLAFSSGSAFAQATGTLNGRVIDQGSAVVPGATVTAARPGSGFTRTTTTNDDGLYTIPALEPGQYELRVSKSGFANSTRTGVTLVTDTTLTLDFQLAVAGTTQQVEVTAAAPIVETTQSEVSGTMQTSEVQNLPMLNRNFTGLVTLVPGARQAGSLNTNKYAMGAGMSFGGGGGRDTSTLVDGAENKDDIIGGPLMNYTIEGIQEFKVLEHNYGAQYGHANGAVVEVVSKSGTNQIHGSAFAYGRTDGMTAIDYFTETSGVAKAPYDREQFGASLGGPVVKNRVFYFGAYERVQENSLQTEATSSYQQAVLFRNAFPTLGCPLTCLQPVAQIPQPFRDNLITGKGDFVINNKNSLMVRWGQEINSRDNDQLLQTQADLTANKDISHIWSIAGSWTWLISNNTVNSFLYQGTHYEDDCYVINNPPPYRSVIFPSFQVGRYMGEDQVLIENRQEFSDNISHQIDRHSLKFGGGYAFFPKLTLDLNNPSCGRVQFFDDPSTILTNTAKYPQGFATPGAVNQVLTGICAAGGGINEAGAVHVGDGSTVGQKSVWMYLQDDWKVTQTFTLNAGLRYDIPINFHNESEYAANRTYQTLLPVLQAGLMSPFWPVAHNVGIPQNPMHDIGPRLGFAWDVRGNGKSVVRAGGGIFFDAWNEVNAFSVNFQNKKTVDNISTTLVNTAVGVGQVKDYVYGVSPTPPFPAVITTLPSGLNLGGAIISPHATDGRGYQAHGGYTYALTPNTVLSADYTHIQALHEVKLQELNPVENAWDPHASPSAYSKRRLNPAFQAVYGDPLRLGSISMRNTDGRSRYDELILHFERRASRATFQASYTLSGGYAYGGVIGGGVGGTTIGTGSSQPQNQDLQLVPGEYGPSYTDERHRVVLSGVFNLAWGIQVSPVFQVASARPYTLTQGKDLNADGINGTPVAGGDRFINPALPGDPSSVCGCTVTSGQQVSINSQRGAYTLNFDTRVSKIFNLGSESRKLALFVEFYNITNRANFGNQYQGSFAAGAAFEKPNGYLAGLPTSRQMQLGGRFTF